MSYSGGLNKENGMADHIEELIANWDSFLDYLSITAGF